MRLSLDEAEAIAVSLKKAEHRGQVYEKLESSVVK